MAVVPEPVPIVSDVFRFVTLRNPIKPTTTSSSSASSGAKYSVPRKFRSTFASTNKNNCAKQ